MFSTKNLKPVILAVLIGLGALLQGTHAKAAELQTLTVAGGCFWCVESDFESVSGVTQVVSGFTGGTVADPTYKQVTGGGTGHYEAVQITFNPDFVTRAKLISLFFRSIDPTDDGGQFCDRGDTYRTAIFVSNGTEKGIAETAKREAQAQLRQTVVTPILDTGPFYAAGDYHQDFYKGDKLILTRYGPRKQSVAYKLYRKGCGRDARIKELWGDAAPFVHG